MGLSFLRKTNSAPGVEVGTVELVGAPILEAAALLKQRVEVA